jgi:hypothetical protein
MNWSAVAAIAEILGAAGVIISVLYLAYQVKDASKVARRNAAYENAVGINPLLTALGTESEVADLWIRGMQDFDALTPAERVRMSSLLLMLAFTWDRALQTAQSGQLDAWALRSHTHFMGEVSSMPGFRSWYALRREMLSSELQALLESKMQGSTNTSWRIIQAHPTETAKTAGS